jgi:hypothetical protein
MHSRTFLIESQITKFLIRENKKALIDSAYDSIELGIDPDVLYKIYEANNVLYRNLMLVECRYGEYNDKELLNEKLFDTIASKVKGAIYGAGALAKGQGISGAKQAYSGTSMDSRTQYFKNAIGDALHNIKKFDSSDETGLKSIEKFGSIDIKPSKGAVGGAVGDAISGVSSKVAQVAGTIKDKAGNVVSAAYETAMQSALFTYFKSLERTLKDKLKIPGGANAALPLLKQLANKIKPNLTISEDKSLVDKLLQLAQQNPGYANILVGLFISMSKVVMIAVGVATSKALIISAVLGIIVRTAYGKYVKGETVGQAFKKALIVTASTIAIGSLIKGMMAVIHHNDFLTGFKSYFVGGDAAAQQASTQQASTSGATPVTQVVPLNGEEFKSVINPNGSVDDALKNISKITFDEKVASDYAHLTLNTVRMQEYPNLAKLFSIANDSGNTRRFTQEALSNVNPADQAQLLAIADRDPSALIKIVKALARAGDGLKSDKIAAAVSKLSGTTPTNESVYKSTIKEYYNL